MDMNYLQCFKEVNTSQAGKNVTRQ